MVNPGVPARWRYVAPNVVTSIGIGVGLVSMGMALDGATVPAAWMIIIAVLIDKLDGTVARLLGASSRFGEQMDSFADLITFGVAPAVLFLAALGGGDSPLAGSGVGAGYRYLAHACAVLYLIAAAVRLSKFNLLTGLYGPEYFFGLPTTVVGALLATSYLTLTKYGAAEILYYLLPCAFAGLGLLMVSNVALPKLRKRRSRAVNLFQLVNIVLVYLQGLTWYLFPEHLRFPEYLLFITLLYVLTGTISAAIRRIRPPTAEAGASAETR